MLSANRQISGYNEELRAQYPHPQPYSGLALPQLGLGGQSYTPPMQEDPIGAPKLPEIRPIQQFFFVRLSDK